MREFARECDSRQQFINQSSIRRRWENQPAGGWSVEDLDATEIRRTVSEAIRRGRLEDPGTREPAELLRGGGAVRWCWSPRS